MAWSPSSPGPSRGTTGSGSPNARAPALLLLIRQHVGFLVTLAFGLSVCLGVQAVRSLILNDIRLGVFAVATAVVRRLAEHEAWDFARAWSPDGRWLAFTTQRRGNYDVAIVNVATGETRMITSTPGDEFGVEWTPDGRSLVYVSGDTDRKLVTVRVAAQLQGR